MAYNRRTWLARLGTGLNKFSIDGATAVTIVNQPDSVTQQGDALSATNLNDLESRIQGGFTQVESGVIVAGKAQSDIEGNIIPDTYATKEELEDAIGELGNVWNYLGEFSSLPANPHSGDFFLASSTFTEGGVTYLADHLYAYNGSVWSDISAILDNYVSKAELEQLGEYTTVAYSGSVPAGESEYAKIVKLYGKSEVSGGEIVSTEFDKVESYDTSDVLVDTLDLPQPVTLMGLGDIRDEYELETGIKTNRFAMYTFDGTETWTTWGTGASYLDLTKAPKHATSDSVAVTWLLIDALIAVNPADTVGTAGGIAVDVDGKLVCNDSDIASLEGKTILYALQTADANTELYQILPCIKTVAGGTIVPVQTNTTELVVGFDVGYTELPNVATIDDLKASTGKTAYDVVTHEVDEPSETAIPINADQLNGHADGYFATETEADEIRGGVLDYDPSETYDEGDFCKQSNITYICKEDDVTGVFDSSKWTRVDLPTLMQGVQTNADAISSLSGIHHTTISNSTYLRGDIDVYRIGNLVTLIFTAGAKDIQANTYNAIGTLPLGYRPPIEAQTVARSPVSSGGNLAFVIVASTGGIDFYSYVGSSGAITWTFTLTYVTTDPMPN